MHLPEVVKIQGRTGLTLTKQHKCSHLLTRSVNELVLQTPPTTRKMDVKHSRVTPGYSSQTRLRCRALILRVLLSSRHPRKRQERHLSPSANTSACFVLPRVLRQSYGLDTNGTEGPFQVARRTFCSGSGLILYL